MFFHLFLIIRSSLIHSFSSISIGLLPTLYLSLYFCVSRFSDCRLPPCPPCSFGFSAVVLRCADINHNLLAPICFHRWRFVSFCLWYRYLIGFCSSLKLPHRCCLNFLVVVAFFVLTHPLLRTCSCCGAVLILPCSIALWHWSNLASLFNWLFCGSKVFRRAGICMAC